MYDIEYSAQFKKDYKRMFTRHLPEDELRYVIERIVSKKELPAKYRPHKLKGAYRDCWECHIRPDWLLIWKTNEPKNLLSLIRTGTHADLF